jgi:hypothetical protein
LRVRAAPGAFPIKTIFKSQIETDELFVAPVLPSVDRITAFSGAGNRQLLGDEFSSPTPLLPFAIAFPA